MKGVLALACLSLATPALAQSAGQWHGPAQIWGASCGYCHGQGVAPEIRGSAIDPAALRTIVRQGLPGMPQFHASEIDDGEVAALARWIAAARPPAAQR